jgi:hypothetical protein
MTTWIDDINQHRAMVAYFMQDFIGMTAPDVVARWDKLNLSDGQPAWESHLTLYRLAQHACHWQGNIKVRQVFGHEIDDAIQRQCTDDFKRFSDLLWARVEVHDLSKFHDPEREVFEVYTPKLKTLTYGSDEYKQALADMGPGLQHHYKVNPHHPEHYPNGINDMNFADMIEMWCDWLAACDVKRVELNVEQQAKRFGMSYKMQVIFQNSLEQLRFWHQVNGVPSYV